MRCTLSLLFFFILIFSSANELSIKKLESENLENLLEVQKFLISGGEPKTEKSFQELSRRGVKVIVSVDGAIPKVDLAKKYGMQYVHIPTGYNMLSKHILLSIKALAKKVDQKLYIHCHHGKHRGPTVAAVFLIEKNVCTNEESLKLLEEAGTGKQYKGLWASVEKFVEQQVIEPLPELVSISKVDSMVESMAKIDRLYDNLRASYDLGWQPLPNNPDFSAVHGALIMKEFLRESGRAIKGSDPEQYKLFLESEKIAEALEESLVGENKGSSGKLLKNLKQSCIKCHKKFRD